MSYRKAIKSAHVEGRCDKCQNLALTINPSIPGADSFVNKWGILCRKCSDKKAHEKMLIEMAHIIAARIFGKFREEKA